VKIKALKGKLIVFEGIDHSGKSSIVKELYNDLLYHNVRVIKTFQPGDNDEDYNQKLIDGGIQQLHINFMEKNY